SERARVAASAARERARELAASALCWQAPEGTPPEIAAALVEGTMLADYRFDRHKSAPPEDPGAPPKQLERLIVSSAVELGQPVAEAALVTRAVNAARDLQNRPGNDLTPTALAEYAEALGTEIDGLSVETEG